MISKIAGQCTARILQCQKPTYSFSDGKGFLEQVEKYITKAGSFTEIRPDHLNFYMKADNVVKFNLTLTRGSHSSKLRLRQR